MINWLSFEVVVDVVSEFLDGSVKFVFVVGFKFCYFKGSEVFEELVMVFGYVVVIMFLVKGYFLEIYFNFIGIYWGVVSLMYIVEIVEFVDKYLFVGLVFNDYRLVLIILWFNCFKFCLYVDVENVEVN